MQGGSSNAKLSHHLRLTVYSYLPLNTLVTKIATLNSYEKRALNNSAIARANKSFHMSLRHDNWFEIRGRQIPHSMISFIPALVSDIEIELESDFNTLTNEMHGLVIDFIINLPSWFDEGKLTLVVFYTNRLKMVNLDKICRMIAKYRPKLIFKSFELIGPEQGEQKQISHYSYGLNFLIQRSKKIKLQYTYIDLRKYRVVNEDCRLQRLSLFKSSFYPAKRSDGALSPIKLTGYKEIATCNSPVKFDDLTQPEELNKLGITSDHINKILLDHGHKLHKL